MDEAAPSHAAAALRLGPFRLTAHRAIYGTIMVMTALAVFDAENPDGSNIEVILVVLGPLVALAAAHTFSDLGDRHIALGRPLSLADWRTLVLENVEYLYLAVPPLLVLGAATELDLQVVETVLLLLLLGTASLIFWGWLAGRRAGFTPGWQALSAGLYGIVGLVVVVLELVLAAH
jgi:hypothetical protein